MERNNIWKMREAPAKKAYILVSLCLIALALLASITLAWTLFGSHPKAHAASGITEYPTQTNPWGVALDVARGHVWVAEPGCDASPVCSSPPPGVIGRYTISSPGVGQKNFIPPATYNPVFLVVDSSGHVWFTDPTHNALGELIPGTNTWKEYKVPTASAAPYDLILDKSGNIWFTEITAGKIGFFNPSTHTFVEKRTPTAASAPYGITMDASGTVWFAENALPQIGRFTPTTSGTGITMTEISIGTGITPHLITSDSKGNIWYSEAFAGKVGRYNPQLHTHKDFPVSAAGSNTHISGIGVDSNGMVWFNDSLNARVGTLNPTTGSVSAIQFAFAGAHPHDGLVIQSNNRVWITEQYGLRLGKI